MDNIAEQQINFYNKAIELDPYLAEVFFERGLVYHEFTTYENKKVLYAIMDFTKAIELDPTHEYAYYLRSVAFNNYAHTKGGDEGIRIRYAHKQKDDLLTLLKLMPEKKVFIWDKLYFAYHAIGGASSKRSYLLEAIRYETLLIDHIVSEGLTPSFNLYFQRAFSKKFAGIDYCEDLSKACDLGRKSDHYQSHYYCEEYMSDCN